MDHPQKYFYRVSSKVIGWIFMKLIQNDPLGFDSTVQTRKVYAVPCYLSGYFMYFDETCLQFSLPLESISFNS